MGGETWKRRRRRKASQVVINCTLNLKNREYSFSAGTNIKTLLLINFLLKNNHVKLQTLVLL